MRIIDYLENLAYEIRHPINPYGGRRELFIQFAEEIGTFISNNELKPAIDPVARPMEVQSREKLDLKKPSPNLWDEALAYPWWYYGGRKFAHLHYNGEAYILTPGQWQEFSKTITQDFKNKLSKVNSVSFENALEIVELRNKIA